MNHRQRVNDGLGQGGGNLQILRMEPLGPPHRATGVRPGREKAEQQYGKKQES